MIEINENPNVSDLMMNYFFIPIFFFFHAPVVEFSAGFTTKGREYLLYVPLSAISKQKLTSTTVWD